MDENEKPRTRLSGRKFAVRLITLLAIWIISWFLLHGELYQSLFASTFSASTAYLLFTVVTFCSTAGFTVLFLAALAKNEKIQDFREAFKIERLDIKGVWVGFVLVVVVSLLNATLFSFFLGPIRSFLVSVGFPGGAIGLASSNTPLMSPFQAAVLTAFLLAFWWLEVPEELFFRGYVQNNLQMYVGSKASTILSALVWDLSHVFNLVSVVDRFFSGLAFAFLFDRRQSTTPSMIVHPIGNRALLLAVVIPQIWGFALNPASSPLVILALDFIIYAGLLCAVIVSWKLLKLDREKTREAEET